MHSLCGYRPWVPPSASWELGVDNSVVRHSNKLALQVFPARFRNGRVERIRTCHTRAQNLSQETCNVLHDSLEAAGIDATHARTARKKFIKEVKEMGDSERDVSITKCMVVDLGRAALEIAAEDDALVSHSSVALPVDAFISRLDNLSMDFCRHFLPPTAAPPHIFLMNLERFMYIHKEFKRASVVSAGETRGLYLNSVLIRRTGSVVMLALIYSEVVKMLKIFGLLDLDIEVGVPYHPTGLPRGYISSDLQEDRSYDKVKGRSNDLPRVFTTQMLLTEILKNLKEIFWPFQYDPNFGGSLFLRAAYAANCGVGPSILNLESEFEPTLRGVELASAKAAEHRIRRGVWTSTRFGDLRRAMAACERLVLLGTDARELRDYSILLYHCGLYEQSYKHLKLYCSSKNTSATTILSCNPLEAQEDTAAEKLMARLKLIMMEEGWSRPPIGRLQWGSSSEPW